MLLDLKSHHNLPQKERYVNVYRLLLCFSGEKATIEKIQNGTLDFTAFRKEISESAEMQLKLSKIEDETYLPQVKELKLLKRANYIHGNIQIGEKLYIALNTLMVKRRGAIGKKWDTIIDGGVEGWDRYNALKTDKERKQWRIKQYSEWYTSYGEET